MDKNICAPNKYDEQNNTCFSLEQLLEMARAYNRYLTKQKLLPHEHKNINTDLIKIKSDKPYLLKQLLDRFDTVCKGNEICITKQEFMNEIVAEMREEFDDYTFRPLGPLNPNEWLSTIDINKIMVQYEKIYSDFKFLGAVPLNCDELKFCSLYNLDFAQHEKNNIKKIGIIFNHDKFGQSGSHWVSIFMNLETGEFYFCDSVGKGPIGNIKKLIDNFEKYYEDKTGKKIIFKQNKKSYQKDSSECGVYSSNFIIRLLAGESFDNIIQNSLDFKDINSCRNLYFRNKSSKYNAHLLCDPLHNNIRN